MSRELTREAVRQLSKADAENKRLRDLARELYETSKKAEHTGSQGDLDAFYVALARYEQECLDE